MKSTRTITAGESGTMDRHRRRVLRARALTWAGIIATGVLLLMAMLWYPGDDAGTPRGYSFGGDFLSMMGRTRTSSWDNTVSCLVFNGTLIMGGAILAAFWQARASFVARPGMETILRSCGGMMGLAVAGIGLTPCDCFPRIHDTITHLVIVLGVICFSLCFFGSHREFESVRSKLGWLAILVLGGAAQVVFLVLVFEGKISSRPALPVMQKLFVLLLALWAGWQGHLLGRACRTDPAAMMLPRGIRS